MTRFKWLEIALLGFATLLLLATFSRGGLLIAVIASILTFLFAGRTELRVILNWFIAGFQREGQWPPRVGVLLLIFGALVGAGLFLSQKGYITRLFSTQADSFEEFIIKNSAGARAAYTFGALGAYDRSPITGVGLGASGLYIYDNLPDWAMTTVPEIARQLSPENRLYPTPKNMYARLLAETGLFGFVLYFSFLFSVLGDSLMGLQENKILIRYLGIAGLFSLIAIALYNNTQDSFATPNIWLIPGVVAGIMSHTNFTAQTVITSTR
jgi:O-antigen ligase